MTNNDNRGKENYPNTTSIDPRTTRGERDQSSVESSIATAAADRATIEGRFRAGLGPCDTDHGPTSQKPDRQLSDGSAAAAIDHERHRLVTDGGATANADTLAPDGGELSRFQIEILFQLGADGRQHGLGVKAALEDEFG